jgi:hypothetical protein
VPDPPEVLRDVVPAVVRLVDAALAVKVACAVKLAVEALPPPHAETSMAVATAQADKVMVFLSWYTAWPPKAKWVNEN